MPVRRIIKNGKPAYQYGATGKVYASKAKAEAQGRAIRISQARQAKKK